MIKLNSHRGFTLSEVMIVVTILVVLSTMLLIGLNPMTQLLRGFDTRRKDDLHKLNVAFEGYYADHDCYPSKTILSKCGTDSLKPYLSSIPCDPEGNKPYDLKLIPENSTCPQQYAVYAHLSNSRDKDANKIAGCPSTIAVNSPGMSSYDIAIGCGASPICYYLYGCVNGQCVQVGEGGTASCGPTYCPSDCNKLDCTLPVNSCVPK